MVAAGDHHRRGMRFNDAMQTANIVTRIEAHARDMAVFFWDIQAWTWDIRAALPSENAAGCV